MTTNCNEKEPSGTFFMLLKKDIVACSFAHTLNQKQKLNIVLYNRYK
jgi:hypothetical protein